MRMHIEMDEALIERVDALAGKRGRSRFVRDAILAAIEQRDRTALILSARGAISDRGHEWDADPAAWVRAQRRLDRRRVG